MHKSRAELLASMDAAELVEWEAVFSQIEPFPEDRADLRMGIAVANGMAPYLKKGVSPPKPADFIPQYGDKPKRPKQSIDEMKAQWSLAVSAAKKIEQRRKGK